MPSQPLISDIYLLILASDMIVIKHLKDNAFISCKQYNLDSLDQSE